MSYQPAITIEQAIDNIKEKKYVLPSIQREYVWDMNRIVKLFDSLMQGYPIGTFLFWNLDKEKIKNFQFYEFLRKYSKKTSTHNPKTDPPTPSSEDGSVIAVLDGQQRLTALYLGLVGSYAEKKKHARIDDDRSYPERKLYLNLYKPSGKVDEMLYDFRFLLKEEAMRESEDNYWFECQLLSYEEKEKILNAIPENGKKAFAKETLNRFYDTIHKKKPINFYLEKCEELEKALQIFIRTNDGGKPLSYSDLLLSIATAQWKTKDAREEIHEFVDEINKIGSGFDFNKDLVLKTCLVLGDGDVTFKVDNFNKSNMRTIEENWDEVSLSLKRAIELVTNFGYDNYSLIAKNAVIPIAYFIFANQCENKILESGKWKDDRQAISEWLARALLKSIFGGQPDSIYPQMRKLIRDNLGTFPLNEIIEEYIGTSKSISFHSEDMDTILNLQYGDKKTYCALTLLYPVFESSYKLHQDHIHPKSKFTKQNMKNTGFSDEDIENNLDSFRDEMNNIANLQLLGSTANEEKSSTPFKDWISEFHSGETARNNFLELNYIDANQSLEFKDFLEFIEKRREKIKMKFMDVLGVTSEENTNQ